jgi:hypothetical protein
MLSVESALRWFVPLMTVFDSKTCSPNAAAGAEVSGRRATAARTTKKVTAKGEVGRRRLTREPQIFLCPAPGMT